MIKVCFENIFCFILINLLYLFILIKLWKKGGVGKFFLIIRDYNYLRIYLDGCEKEISIYKIFLSLNRLFLRKIVLVWIICKYFLDFYFYLYIVLNDEKI